MANLILARPRPSGPRPFRPSKVLTRALPGCFVPPPPPPLPAWIVLDESVRLGAPPVGLEQEWAIVECASRTAYGCGEHGQKVLDGLTLYVRLVKSICVTSSLYIHTSDEALRGIRAEFGEGNGPPIPIDGNELQAVGVVSTANQDVLVLAVVFRLRHFHMRAYYIVYDSVDGSLAMVPCPPEPSHFQAGLTPTPLIMPRARRNGTAGYELVLMWETLMPPLNPREGHDTYEDVLYQWTPAARSEAPAWRVQGLRFPAGVDKYFVVEVMFAFQDKAFFVDLSQGLLYCDLPTADGSVVDFTFIPLPQEVPSNMRWTKTEPDDMGPMNCDRSMNCVAGFIKFVDIDRSAPRPEDVTVTVFTLDLPSKQWNRGKGFRSVELWKYLGFNKKSLPETVPKCPVLMPDDTLCLLLPNLRKTKQDPTEDYICNFKVLNSQSFRMMSFLWSSRLDNCSYTQPTILRWDFFSVIVPPPNTIPRRAIFM